MQFFNPKKDKNMSEIVTTRTYQRGDNFSFTVASKNGYGVSVANIPSMQEYLIEDSETIEPLGSNFEGTHNSDLYPGVRISGQINNISVNYEISSNVCRQLTYVIKFEGGYDPIRSQTVEIETPENIPNYPWSPNPYILETPTGSNIPSDLIFTSWLCDYDGLYYNAGSRIYINSDMTFTAQWQPAPVSVGVESNTESSTIPEFENQ